MKSLCLIISIKSPPFLGWLFLLSIMDSWVVIIILIQLSHKVRVRDFHMRLKEVDSYNVYTFDR